MAHTYSAYIDEAGDEGYEILEPPHRKSSEWFALSAVIVHRAAVPHLEKHFQQFNAARAVASKTKPPPVFHFRKARHNDRVAFAHCVASSPITGIIVFAHKPSVPEEAVLRTRPHYLFDYSTKLLLERISWYCDDHKGREHGIVQITFSQRRQLKLRRVRTYLELLKSRSKAVEAGIPNEIANNDIRWNVIDLDQINKATHDSMIGLQIADCVVSAGHRALEWSHQGTTEHRYIKILQDRIYRYSYGRRAISYGIKFIFADLPDDDPFGPNRLHWLNHFR